MRNGAVAWPMKMLAAALRDSQDVVPMVSWSTQPIFTTSHCSTPTPNELGPAASSPSDEPRVSAALS